MIVKPVILCGGSGTRLWPLSTPQRPKQFQALTAAQTMIALTIERLSPSTATGLNIGQTMIVGSQRHEALLREQAPEAQLILEPFGRNSAPAVAAACLASAPDDLILILPADHHIERPKAFIQAIAIAQEAANTGSIVTFGIQPDHAATGYGYIESVNAGGAIHPVLNFVEKPPQDIADAYFKSGDYFWNAGIFLFKASAMLEAFETHAPAILAAMRPLVSLNEDGICTLDPDAFAKVEDISIDYAIMEPEADIKVVPVDMGWSDVGGYPALWDMFAKSKEDCVTFGPVIAENSPRTFVRSEGPLVTLSGLEGLVVIAKPGLVMIAPRDDANAAKVLGAAAQKNPDAHAVLPETSERAHALLWAAFERWSSSAWDEEKGGFVESLKMDGEADLNSDRRVRVQARQVYSFARAISLGWPKADLARDFVSRGLNYLNTVCKHPEGGWMHRISASGAVVDASRDLYDHAFVMMAGAAAFEATRDQAALEMSETALAFIDEHLADAVHGGYKEGIPAAELRRANPHMHLLEAFLAMYQATGTADYLNRATQIVSLFERHFFDPDTNILREYFKDDWRSAEGNKGRLFEPGHHYEWATLLALHDRLTGRDTLSWRRRLIATADRFGRDKESGFAHNSALPDGDILDDKRRIWHQLEMFRARVLHPETATPGDADHVLENIQKTYFDRMPSGTWIDETDATGQVTSTAIPASILYHLVTALTPALRL